MGAAMHERRGTDPTGGALDSLSLTPAPPYGYQVTALRNGAFRLVEMRDPSQLFILPNKELCAFLQSLAPPPFAELNREGVPRLGDSEMAKLRYWLKNNWGEIRVAEMTERLRSFLMSGSVTIELPIAEQAAMHRFGSLASNVKVGTGEALSEAQTFSFEIPLAAAYSDVSQGPVLSGDTIGQVFNGDADLSGLVELNLSADTNLKIVERCQRALNDRLQQIQVADLLSAPTAKGWVDRFSSALTGLRGYQAYGQIAPFIRVLTLPIRGEAALAQARSMFPKDLSVDRNDAESTCYLSITDIMKLGFRGHGEDEDASIEIDRSGFRSYSIHRSSALGGLLWRAFELIVDGKERSPVPIGKEYSS
jgi:hypothetical protein